MTKDNPVEESEIQPGAADIQSNIAKSEFAVPNSRINPVISGYPILGGRES